MSGIPSFVSSDPVTTIATHPRLNFSFRRPDEVPRRLPWIAAARPGSSIIMHRNMFWLGPIPENQCKMTEMDHYYHMYYQLLLLCYSFGFERHCVNSMSLVSPPLVQK